MASFVESATLKVNDQASAEIRKINAALKALQKTANSLSSKSISITVTAPGLAAATRNVRGLQQALYNMRAAASNIRISASTAGLTQASRQIAALRAQAQKPITVATHTPRTGAAVGGGGPRGGAFAGLTRGVAAGSGLGSTASYLIGSYGAVAGAGYAAAAALHAVADAASKRDRATLQANVQASQAQRDIFEKAAKAPGGVAPGGAQLPMTQDELKSLWVSLLGDVTSQKPGVEGEKERAASALVLTKYLAENVVPRLYAADPTRDREKTLGDLRQLIQATNLATGEMVRDGKITADGMRALNAIQRAQAADPQLTAQTIKTTMANLKTSGFTLNEEALTAVIVNSGNRGVRAANELFQAQLALSGTVDNKALKAGLNKLGLLTDVVTGKKGKVISGQAVDNQLLLANPFKWIHDKLEPMIASTYEKSRAARMEQAKREGKSEAEIKEAGEPTAIERTEFINKNFGTMRQTARQAIIDILNGWDTIRAAWEQSGTATAQNANEALKKSWSAAVQRFSVEMTNQLSGLGEKITKGANLAGLLDSFTKQLKEQPALTMTGAALTGAGALGLAVRGLFSAATAPIAVLGRTSTTTAGAISRLGFAANAAAGRMAAGGAAGAAGAGAAGAGAAAAGAAKKGILARALSFLGKGAARVGLGALGVILEPIIGAEEAGETGTDIDKAIRAHTATIASRDRAQDAINRLTQDLAAGKGTEEEREKAKQAITALQELIKELVDREKETRARLDELTKTDVIKDIPKLSETDTSERRAAIKAAKKQSEDDKRRERERRDAQPPPKVPKTPDGVQTPTEAIREWERQKRAARKSAETRRRIEDERRREQEHEEAQPKPVPTEQIVKDVTDAEKDLGTATSAAKTTIEDWEAGIKAATEANKAAAARTDPLGTIVETGANKLVEGLNAAASAAISFGGKVGELLSNLPAAPKDRTPLTDADKEPLEPVAPALREIPPAASSAAAALRALKLPERGEPLTDADKEPLESSAIGQFKDAANTISVAPSAFASAFGTGAAQLRDTGPQIGSSAAGAFQSASGGIGAAIGSAAAASFRSQVSGMSINVNANVVGAGGTTDKGHQSATGAA